MPSPLPRLLPPALLLLAPLVACGDKRVDTGTPDVPDGDCAIDEDCQPWQICEEAACVDGDRSNDWDEAVPILWDQDVTGWLNPADDVDWYALEAAGGEWVRIDTRPSGTEEGEDPASEDLDTVVSVHDPTGKLHTWEDDFPTGSVNGLDTVLFTYLPTPGTWLISVQDASQFYAETASDGGPDFIYVLRVEEFSGVTDEPDTLDDPSTDVEVAGSGWLYTVGVLLEEPGDSDWVEVELPYDRCPVYLQGSDHLEGSDAEPRVAYWLPSGERLLDREGLSTSEVAIYPEVDGGSVILQATDADGEGDPNHWYILILSVDDEGEAANIDDDRVEWQHDAEGDDLPEGATPLLLSSFRTDDGDSYQAAFSWGTLTDVTDQDWFEVTAPEGWYLTVYGNGIAYGSLLDAGLTVLDPLGAEYATTIDGSGSTGDPELVDVGPLQAGTYTLGVSADAPCEGTGPDCFYTLAVFLTEFLVDG